MFNRFWKNKDDSASKSGPPGHRGSQPGGGDAAGNGGAAPEPVGGGFFNLPPTVARGPSSYNAPGAAPSGSAPQPGSGGPSQYGRPASGSGGHHSVPSYGAPQPPSQYGQPQPPSYGNHAPAPATGGMDMFGGMSLKAPAAVPSGYGGPSQPVQSSPAKYGGGYGAPQMDPTPNAAPAMGGSLFSGLDVASSGTGALPPASYGHEDEIVRPPVERKKPTGRSFNYLDVAASSSGAESVPVQRQSVGSFSRPGASKTVKKKKTKSFRPGFGRQLSDESIAALQRGDLQPEDVMQQHQSTEEPAPSAPPRMATNATDLAHLLPPVKGGSVLAGLTVHDGGSTSSSGGVLAGLTVHGGGSPRGSSKSDPPPPEGGLLAGLNVYRKPSVDEQSDASTSVVLPSSSEKPTTKKKKTPPQEPEKPLPPPTPEEKLMNTLRDFHASAVSFRNSSLEQNDEENKILERKVQLAKQLTQYEIDLRTIEVQQQQAVEVEDFEKADALNSTINSVRHCITLSESDIRKVDGELAAFVKAKEKAFTNQLKSTRGTLKELEKFRDDQDAERTALREELKKYEAEQTERLQFEAERIETELNHVSSHMDNLKSEKEEIETTIEEQCKNEITLREELLIEKAGVHEEILELERQLQIKVEQMRGIQASIDKAEKDIDAVRSRYSRQLKRIDDREEGLQKNKTEVEADAEQLKQERTHFADTIQDYGVRISAFGKRMKAVKKEMRAAVLLATVLEGQETRREQAIIRRKQQTAELTALADSAAIAEQSFAMLRKQHEELEKSLIVHQNTIASAQAMIPQLEQDKKAAAAQRDFKGAARISKDIKALEKDQSTAEEMVEVVEMELQDLKERIEKRQTEYEEKKEELKTVEKQLELNTLHELWKEARSLRQSLRKLEKVKSEGAAASDGVDFRSSALLLVHAEHDACVAQIKALEAKYDVTDPTGEDEDEDVDEEEYDDDESVEEDFDEHPTVSSTLVNPHETNSTISDHTRGSVHVKDVPVTLEEVSAKITELELQIEEATDNEEYERAAKLDEQVEALRQHEAVLRASAGSSTATNPTGHPTSIKNKHGEAAEAAHEGDGDENDEEVGNTPEELEDELRLLRARIKMLEADIERDTENEEYEAAAELEEELQQLREEESEIVQLLAESQQQANDDEMHNSDKEVSTVGPSLFAGLGMSNATHEVSQEASSGASMFAGLQVSSSGEAAEEVVGDKEAPPMNDDAPTSSVSPKETPASPRRLSIGSGPNSPRRKSSGGMFSGLQVNAGPVVSPHKASGDSPVGEPVDNIPAPMFDGLQLGSSSSASVSGSEGSVFAGLQVVSSQVDTENSASLFGGLTVAAKNEDSTNSDDGVIVHAEEVSDEVDASLEETEIVEKTETVTTEATNMNVEVSSTSVDTHSVTSSTIVSNSITEKSDASSTEATIMSVEVSSTSVDTHSVTSSTIVSNSITEKSDASSADSTSSPLDMFGGLSLASSVVASDVETAEAHMAPAVPVPGAEPETEASTVDIFGGLSLAPAASTTTDVTPSTE